MRFRGDDMFGDKGMSPIECSAVPRSVTGCLEFEKKKVTYFDAEFHSIALACSFSPSGRSFVEPGVK